MLYFRFFESCVQLTRVLTATAKFALVVSTMRDPVDQCFFTNLLGQGHMIIKYHMNRAMRKLQLAVLKLVGHMAYLDTIVRRLSWKNICCLRRQIRRQGKKYLNEQR
jgi:hypothetical protein